MSKVDRWIVVVGRDGGPHDRIECALRSDGSSPAREFLIGLKAGALKSRGDRGVDPDSTQVHDFFVLLDRMRATAYSGEPAHGRTGVNSLGAGLWEFKGGTARIPFFDVDQFGRHEPKNEETDRAIADPDSRREYWWYPDLDPVLRLTHGFFKDSQRTDQRELDLANEIRGEDLAHG